MNRKTLVFTIVALLGLIADQASKYWVRANLDLHRGVVQIIPGWFDFVHAENPGAAGGLLRNFEYRHLVFLGFTIIAFGVIIDMWRKLPSHDIAMSAVLGMILSGAAGNAIDRVHKRTVTDFLRVYSESPSLKPWLINTFGTNEWPTFNIADSLLVVGVIAFLLYYLFAEEKEKKPVSTETPTTPA